MKTTTLTAILLLVILLTGGLTAQERRVVHAGGPSRHAETTKDWPKLTERAADDAAANAALTAYLDALGTRKLFSGTVLVARDGKPFFHRSYGTGNNNTTKYNLGSVNKIFTHVAMLQLRDAGKVDFDKTIRTYLPDYPDALADKVTIEQLIEHKSGMGMMFGERFDAARDRLRSMADYAKVIAGEPLAFEPGTEQRYSNAGYIVLGLIIEKVSGMSYYDYVRETIFKPAGMNDTDSYLRDATVANRATGLVGAERTPNTSLLPARGSSAGGGYSTVEDLLRFTTSLKKLISAKAYQDLVGDAPAIGWAGGFPGVNAMVMLTGRYTIVSLSNYDSPAAMEVAQNVRRALPSADHESDSAVRR